MKKENIISFLVGFILSAIIFISIQFLLIGDPNRYEGAMLERGFSYILDKKTGEMKIFIYTSDKPIILKFNDEKNTDDEK